MTTIRPIPDNFGVGFVSMTPLPQMADYTYKAEGRFHNYHVNENCWKWPLDYPDAPKYVVDAFSPNLNKHLHVGHLRNLALAKSLQVLFKNSRFVSMLGHSLGISPEAEKSLYEWLDFVGYKPEIYTDLEMSDKAVLICEKGEGDYKDCLVWKGPKGPEVIRKSDGKTTYAYHDLAFAQIVAPTHYLTGAEQQEHFQKLNLGDKHLSMGLVLDPVTKKKIKSRDGNALLATDAIRMVIDRLDETPEPKKLAWNILAWNFLHVVRSQNVSFNVEEWTKPEQAGLYITYTYARIASALSSVPFFGVENVRHHTILTERYFHEIDYNLLGYACYYPYWRNRATEQFDPVSVASYAHNLARMLGNAYHTEQIRGGRLAFIYAIRYTHEILGKCMLDLGMFPLTKV